MNKSELIRAVAAQSKQTLGVTSAVLDELMNTIVKQVKANNSVTIPGFGTFEVTTTKAREGRNPFNGQAIKIPAKRHPRFRAGSVFKSAVNS